MDGNKKQKGKKGLKSQRFKIRPLMDGNKRQPCSSMITVN